MKPALSTRAQSRASGSFVRTSPGSHSLERGLDLLRAFRLGSAVLTNADLATRCGLPRSTVSRLTRSLVDAGFLSYDHGEQGYRLSVVCLSLGLSYRTSQAALDAALPLMRKLAEGRRINVGLAVLDQTDMVYLDSVRLGRSSLFRRLVPGSRIPAAITALGRAYMFSMPANERQAVLRKIALEQGSHWPRIQKEISASFKELRQLGYCWAEWQEGVVAIATSVKEPNGQRYALNVSSQIPNGPMGPFIENHGELLRGLTAAIEERWQMLG
ncbi:MAG: IclR family transcriptional regulator [Ottowia sp.]|uniref:IclR family transcriptional regulator n=1 Tax=unclassified Ottowia TaxID=2645081 RepID=UPI003C2DB756